MVDAMVRSGLVTKERATEMEKTQAISEEMTKEQRLQKRKKQCEAEVKQLIEESKEHSPECIARQLSDLVDTYPDVFDEVSTMAAFKLNLSGVHPGAR